LLEAGCTVRLKPDTVYAKLRTLTPGTMYD